MIFCKSCYTNITEQPTYYAEINDLCLCRNCYKVLTHEDELESLKAQLADALGMLQDIGSLAHENSTGPAVPDVLWEIRNLAHSAI